MSILDRKKDMINRGGQGRIGAHRPGRAPEWAGSHMADFTSPRKLHLVDEIPRNATGKIDKPALRERASR